jgi:hypothetical protein
MNTKQNKLNLQTIQNKNLFQSLPGNKGKATNNKTNNKATNKATNNKATNNKTTNKATNNKATNNKANNNKTTNNKANNNKAANNKAANKAANNKDAANNKANRNKLNNNIANSLKQNESMISNLDNIINSETSDLNNLNSDIEMLQNKIEMEDVGVPFYIKHKKLLIAIAVIVGIILLYVFGKYIYNNYFVKKKIDNQKLYIDNHSSVNYVSIPNDEIVEPKNGFDYSMTLWIYIDDLYQNYGMWRHILHKGNYNGQEVLEYNDWDDLCANFNHQGPGLWLHPTKPILRFAVTIQSAKNYCDNILLSTKDSCVGEDSCQWSPSDSKCIMKQNQPNDLYKNGKINYSTRDDDEDNYIIQYVDIDVPVKTAYHLGFVFDQKVLNVYVNGELSQTAKFMGEPVSNKHDLHLCLKNNFSGNIIDFYYYPDTILQDKVRILSQTIPNFEGIPSKKRIMYNLKKGNVAKAVDVLF